MAFSITNGGTIQIFPFGRFPHPWGIVEILDELAAREIVKNFSNRACPVPVDFDHLGGGAGAHGGIAGTLTELFARPDGLWASAAWSSAGHTAIRNGRYRFLSPVFSRLENVREREARPLELSALALTNRPVIRGQPLTTIAIDGSPIDRAKAQLAAATALQRKHGGRFSAAWDRARLAQPELFA